MFDFFNYIRRLKNETVQSYLWEISPVVTVDEVDMTFFPATSTASQILPVKRIKVIPVQIRKRMYLVLKLNAMMH